MSLKSSTPHYIHYWTAFSAKLFLAQVTELNHLGRIQPFTNNNKEYMRPWYLNYPLYTPYHKNRAERQTSVSNIS